MEIIKDFKKNVRRYVKIAGLKPKTIKRKTRIVLDFLFWIKKQQKIDRIYKLKNKTDLIEKYIEKVKQEKQLAEKTLNDYKRTLLEFFSRANLQE